MKTVIVFDTADRQGMESTVKIVDYLAEKYLSRRAARYNRSFGKIEFIKILRSFANQVQKDFDLNKDAYSFNRLKYTKEFADKIWNDEF